MPSKRVAAASFVNKGLDYRNLQWPSWPSLSDQNCLRDCKNTRHWCLYGCQIAMSSDYPGGTNIRFGLDALIGLILGFGDMATGAISLAFVLAAMRQGEPFSFILEMGWNILVDLVLGALPIVGDIFHVTHKANTENLSLLREFRVQQKPAL